MGLRTPFSNTLQCLRSALRVVPENTNNVYPEGQYVEQLPKNSWLRHQNCPSQGLRTPFSNTLFCLRSALKVVSENVSNVYSEAYNPGSTTNLASATIKKIDEPGCNVYGLKWATKLPPFFAEEIPLTRLIGVRTDPAIFLIMAINKIVVLPGL